LEGVVGKVNVGGDGAGTLIELAYLPNSSELIEKGQRNLTPALPFCHAALRARKPKDQRYPTEIKTIGDQLRARRLDLGLDQEDVAARLGVSEDSVCYWENNRVEPSPLMQRRIQESLTRAEQ
jgi:DNA-binding XRE family transcriptional regulator